MTDSSPTRTTSSSLTRDLFDVARPYLGGRRSLYILAGIAAVAGLAFNWNWLVAAGIAPVLLATLPCVAMCALGLCMHRVGGQSCARDTARDDTALSSDEVAPPPIPQRLASGAGDEAPSAIPSTNPQSRTAEERRTVDA